MTTYDGLDAAALRRRLGVPRLSLHAEIASTMDVAHALAAEGAPAGTLVLADAQTLGRGRQGRPWQSAPGQGIWLTLLERPRDPRALDVLSLRLGLRAAIAVEPWADGPVQVKWPNDLQVARRKLAGVLVEARWREAQPEWVAIGFGLNVRAPAAMPEATGLRADAPRVDVLAALVPALRAAAADEGPLGDAELRAFAARDALVGRAIVAPLAGRVAGVLATGELLVEDGPGSFQPLRQATVVLGD